MRGSLIDAYIIYRSIIYVSIEVWPTPAMKSSSDCVAVFRRKTKEATQASRLRRSNDSALPDSALFRGKSGDEISAQRQPRFPHQAAFSPAAPRVQGAKSLQHLNGQVGNQPRFVAAELRLPCGERVGEAAA